MTSGKIIKRVIRYIGKYKYSFFISLVLTLVSTICTLYIPVLAGEAIDSIVGMGNVDFVRVGEILTKILVALLVAGVSQYFTTTLNTKIANNTVRDMRSDAFDTIQTGPISYIDSR